MNNIKPYNEFLSEGALSSVTSFLKQQYNNIFQNPNQVLSNLFTVFTKKVDVEKNTAHLYQQFTRNNQTNIQNEINKAESIDAVNKLVSDEVKYFYFSLKPIVNKLQNDEFTMEKIFERSRDKRLQKLMSYPEDQFSNAVQQYINDAPIPEIKKDAGLDKPKPTAAPSTTPSTNQPTTERIKYKIQRILEADETGTQDADLIAYKKSAIKWLNMSLFDLLKPKMQLLNQLGANNSNTIDMIAKQMKGSTNINAKKMILNKVINMNKEELQDLANKMEIKPEDLGQL